MATPFLKLATQGHRESSCFLVPVPRTINVCLVLAFELWSGFPVPVPRSTHVYVVQSLEFLEPHVQVWSPCSSSWLHVISPGISGSVSVFFGSICMHTRLLVLFELNIFNFELFWLRYKAFLKNFLLPH